MRRVDFDPEFPTARDLVPLPPSPWTRFWPLPEPEVSAHFLGVLVKALGPGEEMRLWKAGFWRDPEILDPESNEDDPRVQVSTSGIPVRYNGAVKLVRGEWKLLLPILQEACYFSRHRGEDLYLVPDHGQWVLETDHHRVVWAKLREAEQVTSVVAAMESEGYPLPRTLPDATFKRPDWMSP